MQVAVTVPKGDDSLAQVVAIEPGFAFPKPCSYDACSNERTIYVPQFGDRLAARQRLRDAIRAEQREAAVLPAG
jgi:hypothetical protein